MGDDPIIPAELIHSETLSGRGGSAATGGSIVNVYNFGKTGMILLVVFVGLSMGLSIGAVTMMIYGQTMHREQTTQQIGAVERRTMDKVNISERETRVNTDKIQDLRVEVDTIKQAR